MCLGKLQHKFTKGKLGVTSLVTFCGETTSSVASGEQRTFTYLDFSRVFDPASHSLLADKPLRYRLNTGTTSCMENCLN